MQAYPHAVKPPRELRLITPDMSVQEAAEAYAETLRAIPGLIEPDDESTSTDATSLDRTASDEKPAPPCGAG